MDGWMDGINNRNGLFVHRLIDILVSLFVHRPTDNRKIKCNYFDDLPKAEKEFPECETARKTGMNKKWLSFPCDKNYDGCICSDKITFKYYEEEQ